MKDEEHCRINTPNLQRYQNKVSEIDFYIHSTQITQAGRGNEIAKHLPKPVNINHGKEPYHYGRLN